MIKKPKKKSKKGLEKKCMALWQELVKLRASNKCEYVNCEKTEYLNAHHIFSRSRGSVKYDPDNGMCLCSGHHSLNIDSAHKNPEFLKIILGEVDGYEPIRTTLWYQMLRLRAYTPQKIDLELQRLYLEQEINNFNNFKPYRIK